MEFFVTIAAPIGKSSGNLENFFDLSTIITSVVVAATITGIVALAEHIIAKGNARLAGDISRANAKLSAALESSKKLAESRQVWIDALRQDMALYYSLKCNPTPSTNPFEKTNQQLRYDKIHELESLIKLRMNPSDPDYENLMVAMDGFIEREHYVEDEVVKALDLEDLDRYISVCQQILKREWDVLRTELKQFEFLTRD